MKGRPAACPVRTETKVMYVPKRTTMPASRPPRIPEPTMYLDSSGRDEHYLGEKEQRPDRKDEAVNMREHG